MAVAPEVAHVATSSTPASPTLVGGIGGSEMRQAEPAAGVEGAVTGLPSMVRETLPLHPLPNTAARAPEVPACWSTIESPNAAWKEKPSPSGSGGLDDD